MPQIDEMDGVPEEPGWDFIGAFEWNCYEVIKDEGGLYVKSGGLQVGIGDFKGCTFSEKIEPPE